MQEEFDDKTKVLIITTGGIRFETFPTAAGMWHWRARSAKNRKKVATAGESFAKRGNAERSMRKFIEGVRK